MSRKRINKKEVLFERLDSLKKIELLFNENIDYCRVVLNNKFRTKEKVYGEYLHKYTYNNGDLKYFKEKYSYKIDEDNQLVKDDFEVTIIKRVDNKWTYAYSYTHMDKVEEDELTVYTIFDECLELREDLIKEMSFLPVLWDNSLLLWENVNTIIEKKLFQLNKAIKHVYLFPYETIGKVIHEEVLLRKRADTSSHSDFHITVNFVRDGSDGFRTFENIIKNKENLDIKWLADNEIAYYFINVLKMGYMLNREVNCSWTVRRLQEVYKSWTEEYASINGLISNKTIAVKDVFLDFAEYSGYNLIKTESDLHMCSLLMTNCTGGYFDRLNTRREALYLYKDHCILLSHQDGNFYIDTIYQKMNSYAVESVRREILTTMEKFMNKNPKYKVVSQEEIDNKKMGIYSIGIHGMGEVRMANVGEIGGAVRVAQDRQIVELTDFQEHALNRLREEIGIPNQYFNPAQLRGMDGAANDGVDITVHVNNPLGIDAQGSLMAVANEEIGQTIDMERVSAISSVTNNLLSIAELREDIAQTQKSIDSIQEELAVITHRHVLDNMRNPFGYGIV